MSETKEQPEDQDAGWLPTLQDDIDRLRDMIRSNAPPETCHFDIDDIDTPRSSLEPCPPARRNSCILPITGYNPVGQGCPLQFCHDSERLLYLLNDLGLSLDEFLDGDYAPLAMELMLNLLKRRCMATILDSELAEPKSPADQERWAGVLHRSSLRIGEIFEARFCLLRDLKVRRDMPKDVRRALRRLKETNGDHLTPQERAKEGRTIPDPEEPDIFSLLGIRPPRNQPGIGKHPSPDGNGPPLWAVQLAAVGRAHRARQRRRLGKKQLAIES